MVVTLGEDGAQHSTEEDDCLICEDLEGHAKLTDEEEGWQLDPLIAPIWVADLIIKT